MKSLLAANFLALVGASIAFIPLGHSFERLFPIGLAWACLFALGRLPSLAAGPLFVAAARVRGPEHTIVLALAVALIAFAGILAASAGPAESVWAMLICFGLFRAALSAVDLLFPVVLAGLGGSVRMFGNWQLLLSTASICSILIGGVLYGQFSLTAILLLTSLLLALALSLWIRDLRRRGPEPASAQALTTPSAESLRQCLQALRGSRLLQLIAVRGFAFGILNPVIPVTISSVSKFGDTALGFAFFVLGVASVFGALVSKWIVVTRTRLLLLVVIELGTLLVGIGAGSLWLFLLALSMSSFLNSLLEVHTLRAFIRSHPHEADFASVLYKVVYNLALVAGYFAAALFVIGWPLSFKYLLFTAIIAAAALLCAGLKANGQYET